MVWIRCQDGRLHQGRIVRVTPSHVYLVPMASPISDKGKKNSTKLVDHALGTNKAAKASEVLFFFPLAIPLAAILSIGLIGAAAAYNPWFWW